MGRSKNDVWVGLFVLIGAVAIAFLALQSANLLSLSFQPTYRVVAKFDNIGGLKPNTTYHFRLIASNATGVTSGRDRTFRTDKVPLSLGMTATLTLADAATERVAKLPLSALFSQGSNPSLYIVDDAGAGRSIERETRELHPAEPRALDHVGDGRLAKGDVDLRELRRRGSPRLQQQAVRRRDLAQTLLLSGG